MAYLCLLAPPNGSLHASVPASKIVLAGESAGGNLCLALMQLLLHLRQNGFHTLMFNGSAVPVELPAGISLLSGYCDQTECLPSRTTMRHIDFTCEPPVYTRPDFPFDSIWPAIPPRFSAYCETMALAHPLVSPTTAKFWTGCPPMWFACGQEHVVDSNRIIARRASSQGVKVIWKEFEGMPHVFPLLPGMEETPQALRCMAGWSTFIRQCVKSDTSFETSEGSFIDIKGEETRHIVVEDMLLDISDEEVEQRMRKNIKAFDQAYQGRQKIASRL